MYDRRSLERAVSREDFPGFLFFWGHRPERDGRVGPGCLSQWWPAAFEVDGVRYATAEHFMMAEKARLFGDEAILPRILQAGSPGAAKSLGRRVSGFEEGKWTAAREAIVERGNLAKFSQHADLGAWLRATHPYVLVEASPQDRIWGIGLAADHPDAEHPSRWRGLNLLGAALTRVRDRLRES